MADITNDSGEVIVASPSELPIPAEYTGLTIKEIYDAMCAEAGLDPTVRDGKLVPRYNYYTSPSDLFTLNGNVFYDIGNPYCHIQGIAPTIHFYSQNYSITSSSHRQVTMQNVGVSASTGITFPVATNSITPIFSIHFLPNFGQSGYGLDTTSISISNSSINLFYFKLDTRFEMLVRIKLSGEIEVVIKNNTISNEPVFGFLTYLTDEGQPVPASTEPILNPSGTTSWEITDTDIHYYKSPEVERAFIKGIVQKGTGNYLARNITVLDSETKGVRNTTTSSAADGSFSISVTPETEYMVICEDQGADPANALIFDRVVGKPDA